MNTSIDHVLSEPPLHSHQQPMVKVYTHLKPICSLAITPEHFFYGGLDGTINGFELLTGHPSHQLRGHRGPVRALLQPDVAPFPGAALFSSGDDGTIRVWDASNEKQLMMLSGRKGSILSMCCGDSSTALFSAGNDGVLSTWNVTSGTRPSVVKAHSCPVTGIVCDSPIVFTCSLDGLSKSVDVETGQLIAVFEGMTPLKCIAHIPKDQTIAVAGMDGTLRLFDCRTAKCSMCMVGHRECVFTMASMQTKLLSGSDDRTIRLWNTRVGKEEACYVGHTDAVKALFVTQGHVYSGSFDCTLRLWQTPDLELAADGSDVDNLKLIKRQFQKFATVHSASGSGLVLTKTEFAACMESLGCRSAGLISALFDVFDDSGDGEIETDEVVLTLKKFMLADNETIIQRCFAVLDRDGSGELSAAEINALKEEQGAERMGITSEMIAKLTQLFVYYDADRSGSIDFDEFCHFMRTDPQLVFVMFPMVAVDFASRNGITMMTEEA